MALYVIISFSLLIQGLGSWVSIALRYPFEILLILSVDTAISFLLRTVLIIFHRICYVVSSFSLVSRNVFISLLTSSRAY